MRSISLRSTLGPRKSSPAEGRLADPELPGDLGDRSPGGELFVRLGVCLFFVESPTFLARLGLPNSRSGRISFWGAGQLIAAVSGIEQIGIRDPSARDECVDVLSRRLERFPRSDVTLNGFLVELRAVEAAP